MSQVTPIKQIVGTESKQTEQNRIFLLAQTINGGIDFGNSNQTEPGTYKGNMSGQWVLVTTPGTPNTTFTIPHTLGRIPSAYFWNADRAGDLYGLPNQFGTWSNTSVFLRASSASMVINIFLT